MTIQRILAQLEGEGTSKVKLGVTDIDGVMRGKYVHVNKLKSILNGGFGFCDVIFGWDIADVCYDNAKYTGWHTGYPDAHARIDPGSFRLLPWEEDCPFLLADFVDAEGAPLAVCPRQTLKGIIAKAADMGFTAKFGCEFEWFNFDENSESLEAGGFIRPKPITPGMFGYSMIRTGQNYPYFHELMEQMAAFGVPLEGLHTETGPGVFEAAITVDDALEAADRAVLFKTGVKSIAHSHGIMPSFMAKFDETLPGCSGHMHQSLWRGEFSAFYDANDPNTMSATFKSYLAGQLALLPEFAAFYAPTINSYKRLVEGMWAPTLATWGIDNRTVALRVIRGSAKSTRLETRVSGSDINPYLAIAAALASGLYGIEKEMALTEAPVTGNGYEAKAPKIPANLWDAAEALDKSTAARELFGDTFIDHFVATRRWEWREHAKAVTDWERRRYFELI